MISEINEKIKELKSQYKFLNNLDKLKDNVKIVDDIELKNLLIEYNTVSSKNDLEVLLGSIKVKVDELKDITELTTRKKKTEENFKEKKEELSELEMNESNLVEKNYALEKIKDNNLKYEYLINQYDILVDKIKPKEQRVNEMSCIAKMLDLLLLEASISMMKKSKNLLTLSTSTLLFMVGVNNLKKALRKKIIYIPSNNYEEELTNMITDIDYIKNYTLEAKNDITEIKTSFFDNYKSLYKSPKYIENLAKIQKIELLLIEQIIKINEQQDLIKKAETKNKEKVKKIEDM